MSTSFDQFTECSWGVGDTEKRPSDGTEGTLDAEEGKCNLKYLVVISSLWYEDISMWRQGYFFYMTTQKPTDGHFRVPTRRTADTDLALLRDLGDLPRRLMKPLCPQKVSSITSTPAYKYLSHQWQKDLLTVIMSFVSQIEEVCACGRERGGRGERIWTYSIKMWEETWILCINIIHINGPVYEI